MLYIFLYGCIHIYTHTHIYICIISSEKMMGFLSFVGALITAVLAHCPTNAGAVSSVWPKSTWQLATQFGIAMFFCADFHVAWHIQ